MHPVQIFVNNTGNSHAITKPRIFQNHRFLNIPLGENPLMPLKLFSTISVFKNHSSILNIVREGFSPNTGTLTASCSVAFLKGISHKLVI